MPIDTKTPGSPGWWLEKSARKLQSRQKRLHRLAKYHDGDPALPDAPAAASDSFTEFYKRARINLAELVVGSIRERLGVRAIMTAADDDGDGDTTAWDIWKDNDLDIEFSDVLENMIALGDSYMMIGLDPDDDERVVITGEDPRQVVTIHNPIRQSEVRAGLKMFHDADEEKDYAYLFLKGGIDENGDRFNARRYVASRPRKARAARLQFSAGSFDWDEEFGGAEGEELNHELVPIVRFRNRRGIGEFEPHIDLLDRINHLIFQLSVIATYQAFKQRALIVDDDDMPDQDEDGQDIDYNDVLTADPGSWIKIPKGSTVWESQQADLQGILSAIKDALQQLAAVTRTPMSVVSPDAVNQSAEGAALIKEGQVFKTEDKQKRAGTSLVLVYYIAFLCLEDKVRADRKKILVDWAPAERYSLQQKYDAASKAPTGGEPFESIWADVLQKSPEQIRIMKSQRMDDAIIGSLNGPANQPAPAAPAS